MSDRGEDGVTLVEGGETRSGPSAQLDVALSPLRTRPSKPLPRERTALAIWFWEIDRVLLGLIVALIAIGLVAVAAASPVAANKLGKTPLYYFYLQLLWIALGIPVMIVISMLPRTQARRLAVGLTIVFVAALVLINIPIFGRAVNGATRWFGVGPFRFQPSEFLKPFFVVTIAWLLSLRVRDPSLPVMPLTGMMTGIIALLLMRQPDFGQTVIFVAAWGALLLIGGASIRILASFVCAGLGLFVLTYLFYDNGRDRIDAFLNPVVDPAAGPDQVQLAFTTITRGGLTGVGPGGGSAKFNLPEAHTDYIFSVIGEEFGLIACIAIAVVYLALIVRVLLRLLDEEDPFIIMATAGLVFVMGVQAVINMGVNIHIFPSKGMTLPFISYGGSSMIALCAGVGLLLAFTRRNPYMSRSPYVVTWSGR
jgi:cell division protein FtsW